VDALKLSKPQLEILKKANEPGGTRAADYYPPVVKLLAIGLIRARKTGESVWVLTEAGSKTLIDLTE